MVPRRFSCVSAMIVALLAVRPAGAEQPNAPVLRAPANGTALSAVGPAALRWDVLPGTRQYHLRVTPHGNDGPGVDIMVSDPRLVGAGGYTIEAPGQESGNYLLLPGMTYTWQVRVTPSPLALGSEDPAWGPWSEAWQFRTPRPAVGTLTATYPAEGALVPADRARLQWGDRATSNFYYEVQVSVDRQFRTGEDAVAAVWWNLVHGGVSDPRNTWETPPLEAGRVYYWRVRPRVQGDGQPAEWGPVWRFTARHAPLDVLGDEALAGINRERVAAGLSPLTVHEQLTKAALRHSEDMAARDGMGHEGSDGSDPGERIRRAGYLWRAYGEIVAAGYTLAPDVVSGWMASPRHREVILLSEFREFGVGIAKSADGRLYWTVNFGLR